MSKKKINLGIVFPNINDWNGGLNYFKALITALSLIKDKNFDYKIFSSSENKIILESIVPKKKIIYLKCLEKFSLSYFLRKGLQLIYKNDIFLEKILIKKKINIISHYKPLKTIKSICWIPDLQHKILKKNFSKKEILYRDDLFNKYFSYGSKVLVSSETTKSQLIKLYKYIDIKKLDVLNFVPLIQISKIKKFFLIKKKYNLPSQYYFCPNQFWTHKNHEIIIEAVNYIKKKKINFKIIFSGSQKDYRDNKYFLFLMNKIKLKKLSNFFIFLDKISYDDVISIIYYSNGLINPSKFEGWSTTVEEGKLLKKRILLSKIDTHIEQKPKFASYFDIHDFKKLAQYLLIFSKKKTVYKLSKINKDKNSLRIKFANTYYKILKDTLINE